jgi:hypothetical protein
VGIWTIDPKEIEDFSIEEWDEDRITKPMGMEPLSDEKDYSKHPIDEGTPCYMCGPPYKATHRLRGGHPVCNRCLKALP